MERSRSPDGQAASTNQRNTSMATSSSTATAPVVAQVFDTVELLEHILLSLPAHDLLLRAPLVCRRWHQTVKGSIQIQRALYFVPHEQNMPQFIFEDKRRYGSQGYHYVLVNPFLARAMDLHVSINADIDQQTNRRFSVVLSLTAKSLLRLRSTYRLSPSLQQAILVQPFSDWQQSLSMTIWLYFDGPWPNQLTKLILPAEFGGTLTMGHLLTVLTNKQHKISVLLKKLEQVELETEPDSDVSFDEDSDDD